MCEGLLVGGARWAWALADWDWDWDAARGVSDALVAMYIHICSGAGTTLAIYSLQHEHRSYQNIARPSHPEEQLAHVRVRHKHTPAHTNQPTYK